MLNLNSLQFATQSNVQRGDVTEDHFKALGEKPVVANPAFDLKAKIKEGESPKFIISMKFLKDQPEGFGWTTAKAGNDVYLLRTPANHPDQLLRAKFLKSSKNPEFTSNLLAFLLKDQLVEQTTLFRLVPEELQGSDFLAFKVLPLTTEVPVAEPAVASPVEAVAATPAEEAPVRWIADPSPVLPAVTAEEPAPTTQLSIETPEVGFPQAIRGVEADLYQTGFEPAPATGLTEVEPVAAEKTTVQLAQEEIDAF